MGLVVRFPSDRAGYFPSYLYSFTYLSQPCWDHETYMAATATLVVLQCSIFFSLTSAFPTPYFLVLRLLFYPSNLVGGGGRMDFSQKYINFLAFVRICDDGGGSGLSQLPIHKQQHYLPHRHVIT